MKNFVNSVLEYRIVDQTPKVPQDGLFLVQEYSGTLKLVLQSLHKRDTPQYNLSVQVSDKVSITFTVSVKHLFSFSCDC